MSHPIKSLIYLHYLSIFCLIHTLNYVIFKYENNKKGDYTMSKVKQWAENTAEKNVDTIIGQLTSGEIDRSTAKTKIMKVDNLNLVGIDEHNIDEVIYEAHANA